MAVPTLSSPQVRVVQSSFNCRLHTSYKGKETDSFNYESINIYETPICALDFSNNLTYRP